MRVVLSAFIRYYEFLKYFKVENILASQHYREQIKKAIQYTEECPDIPVNLIIDSGAFSAWNANEEVDFDDYLAFVKTFDKEHRHKFNEVWYVNLDVIPGKKGESHISKDMIQHAADLGFENYLKFKEAGFDNVIHVIHQGEDLTVLKRLVDTNPLYIGISPSNDVMTASRKKWLDEVFQYTPKHIKTHGFAVTSMTLMRSFDWFSVDSTSWFMMGVYGKLYIPVDTAGKIITDTSTPIADSLILSISPAKINAGDGYNTYMKKNSSIIKEIDKYIEYLCTTLPITPAHLFDERNEARVMCNLLVFMRYQQQKHMCDYEAQTLF